MKIDLPATIFAGTQQAPSPAGTRAAATGFMTLLSGMQAEVKASPFGTGESAETVETGGTLASPWVPWTEEELSQLAAQGVPESEIQNLREQTFPEVAAERWMQIIAPFLTEASLPNADADALAAGRAKCPFLDWVLSGKDPIEYFQQPGKLSTPLHQVIDGTANPLITAAASPVTLTAAAVKDNTEAGTRRAASLSNDSGGSVLTELRLDNGPAAAGQGASLSDTESRSGFEQRETQNSTPGNTQPETIEVKAAFASERSTEARMVLNAARNVEAAPLAAASAALLLREVVEAPPRAQEAGSKPAFVMTAAPASTEQQPAVTASRSTEAPALPPDSDLFMSELAERIHIQVRQGGNDIRIQLKPANLGHVEITAQTGTEGVVARIVTESSAVKQYLETNLHVLEKALVDQGLRMDRIDVVTQNYLDARQSGAQSDSQYGGSGQRAAAGGGDAASATPALSIEDGVGDVPLRPAIGPNSTFHTVA